MNKKKTLFLLTFGIITIISYLSYSIIAKTSQKKEIAKKIQTIPEFKLKALDSTSYTNRNLKSNLSTIFIYFNSECDFCNHEAESISQNLKEFNNVQFVFVSTENIETIKLFSKKHNLNNPSKITFLHDSNFSFSSIFNAQSIPYILIYNNKKELLKKHSGQLNANGILRVLNKNGK